MCFSLIASMQSILFTLDMINLKLRKLDKLDTVEVEIKEVKATLHNVKESINRLKAANVALKMQVKSLEESLTLFQLGGGGGGGGGTTPWKFPSPSP